MQIVPFKKKSSYDQPNEILDKNKNKQNATATKLR